MNINRREFLSFVLPGQAARTMSSIRVVVLETFGLQNEASAILVRHADPADRDRFAQWLRARRQVAIRLRAKGGQDTPATIFRVRMCFGRGLILLERPIELRESDVLTILL